MQDSIIKILLRRYFTGLHKAKSSEKKMTKIEFTTDVALDKTTNQQQQILGN